MLLLLEANLIMGLISHISLILQPQVLGEDWEGAALLSNQI